MLTITLISKLKGLDLLNGILNWIIHFLTNHSQQVKIGDIS